MWLRVVLWWWVVGLVHGSSNKNDDTCTEAQRLCIFRIGCRTALTNYMLWCSDVVRGAAGCSEPCQHALIALTSTEEGKNLMNCTCNDEQCKKTKQRVEICKPHVLRTSQNETMSCSLSQLICTADVECSTALEYYRSNCKSMFQGKKCSRRCHNSINILKKQEKAAKLNNCRCDGYETYDCPKVKDNMDRLCFHKPTVVAEVDRFDNVPPSSASSLSDSVTLLTLVLIIRIMMPD